MRILPQDLNGALGTVVAVGALANASVQVFLPCSPCHSFQKCSIPPGQGSTSSDKDQTAK